MKNETWQRNMYRTRRVKWANYFANFL